MHLNAASGAAPTCHGQPMVQRRANRGRRAGGFFWGCATYPSCRHIIDIGSIAATPDPLAAAASRQADALPQMAIGQGAVIGSPGRSARRTYERRRQRFDERRPDRLRKSIARGAGLALLALIVLGVARSAWAVPIAAFVMIAAILEAFIEPNTVAAWQTGARGEERTANFLDPLAAEGWYVLHDRKVPMSLANIDHVVIGPPGVFVVETKSYAGKIRISGSEVRIGGHKVAVVEEIAREVDAVEDALASFLRPRDLRVRPIICAHRAELPLFWSSVRGIPIVSGRELVRKLKRQPASLTMSEVTELGELAIRTLR